VFWRSKCPYSIIDQELLAKNLAYLAENDTKLTNLKTKQTTINTRSKDYLILNK